MTFTPQAERLLLYGQWLLFDEQDRARQFAVHLLVETPEQSGHDARSVTRAFFTTPDAQTDHADFSLFFWFLICHRFAFKAGFLKLV
jgi:hypothetical protein